MAARASHIRPSVVPSWTPTFIGDCVPNQSLVHRRRYWGYMAGCLVHRVLCVHGPSLVIVVQNCFCLCQMGVPANRMVFASQSRTERAPVVFVRDHYWYSRHLRLPVHLNIC